MVEVVQKNAEAMTDLKASIDKNSDATDKMSDSLSGISEVARGAMKIKSRRKI